MVSRVAERTITAQDQAAIDKVWAHVGVRRDEYDDSGQWKKVAPARREGVRQRLLDGWRDAFRASDPDRLGRTDVARGRFLAGRTRLACRTGPEGIQASAPLGLGNRLLAAEAANVCRPPPRRRHPPPPKHLPRVSLTSPRTKILRTPTQSVSQSQACPKTPATVVAIMERAAAEGYELSDWDELLRYARNRYVEAAVDPDRYVEAADELGAVNAARDRIIAKAAPSESVSRSRSGRDGASVMSESSLFSRLLELSLDSEREALRKTCTDLLEDRVRVSTIPGLRMKKKKKKVKKAIAKANR